MLVVILLIPIVLITFIFEVLAVSPIHYIVKGKFYEPQSLDTFFDFCEFITITERNPRGRWK